VPLIFTFQVAQVTPDQVVAETAPRDFALDPATGDLLFDGTGDLVFLAGVDGIVSDARAQVQTFLGEWFLDTSIGFPWLRPDDADTTQPAVLGEKPNPVVFSELLRTLLLAVPGIVELLSSSFSYDGVKRAGTASYSYRIDTGQVIVEALGLSFGGT
jgi:hypothetical protein